MTLVMKFGGTSVGSVEAMKRTAELILNSKETWGSVVVVASAMGTKPVKVTDLLLTGAHKAIEGDAEAYQTAVEKLRTAHAEVIDTLLTNPAERNAVHTEINRFINRFAALCKAVLVLGELTPRALDVIGGMGEQMSVRVLAAYLRQLGHPAEAIDATHLIVTDDHFQNATPLFAETNTKTRIRLQPLLDKNVIPIVTGFIAATAEGITTTLGRGGSDYSGSILGQALNAKEVWIWTDVDGVMTTDPRIVSNAQTIPTLSYREVSELAYYGAKVLHPKTIRPVIDSKIPLRIKNTFNPDHPGTVIVAKNKNGNGSIKAVTAIKDVSFITLEGKGMMGVKGTAARMFSAVADSKANVLMITQSSSEQSICLATPLNASDAVVSALETEFAEEISQRDIDRVWANNEVAIITIVGSGMRGTPGISGRVFTTLGDAHINVIAIAQGSSECSISMIVAAEQLDEAVRRIHNLIVPT